MMVRFEKELGVRILQAWGMTETSPLASVAHVPVGVSRNGRHGGFAVPAPDSSRELRADQPRQVAQPAFGAPTPSVTPNWAITPSLLSSS